MNSVLVIDTNGIILDANHAFFNSFGYEKEEIIGENFSILFSEEDQKKDLPQRELRTVIDEGQSDDNNYLVNKDRTLTWVSGESLLLTNTQNQKVIFKIIQNIHAQKESEISIMRLNSFNESILATIEDGVVVLDENFKILKANYSFLKLFGFIDKHFSNIDFRSFLNRFDTDAGLHKAIQAIFRSTSNSCKLQLEIDTPKDEKQTFDISCTKLSEKDEPIKTLLIFHDITDQKQFERQREDILNFVAHEFRNPLTNIILNIDLLDQIIKERHLVDLGDLIGRSRSNAQRLKRLINELYKSAQLISGNFDPDRSVFFLEEAIDEAITSIRQIYSQFRISKKGNFKISLSADKEKLIQVITNYLTNAAKYSEESRDIEVSSSLDGDTVTVAIRDYGKGIPAKDIPYIFNRFYRVQKTKSLEGLGLGLFISRQIITAHGGRAWAESEPGMGSTFYFSIPLPGNQHNIAPEKR